MRGIFSKGDYRTTHRPWGVAESESLKLPVAEMRNVKCGVRFGQVRGTEHVLGMELILFARPV